MFETLILSKT